MRNDDAFFTPIEIKAFETRHDPMGSSQLNPYVNWHVILQTRAELPCLFWKLYMSIYSKWKLNSLPKWQLLFTVSRGRDVPNTTWIRIFKHEMTSHVRRNLEPNSVASVVRKGALQIFTVKLAWLIILKFEEYLISCGHAVACLVQTLCYKPEGRGFDSWRGHWIFNLT
jgi:hypothetical protein